MSKPTSQIKLRLQEILETKQLSHEQLSHLSGVPEQNIRSYTTDSIAELSEAIAADLKAIAAALEICVSELFQPVSNEELPLKEMTVEEWSQAHSIQRNDLAMVSNTVTIGGGVPFCEWFPNAPGCRR